MKKQVDPAIRSRPDLEKEIEKATELLAEEMGASASTARAEWALTQDTKSRELIELRVSDWTGSVGDRFAPDESAN